jgi:ribosomal protein S18 acetylase RimI-like enzyme
MEIKTLSDIQVDDLLTTFNESFSDYLVPLQLTKEQLVSKLRSDRIDLNYSVGTFNENKLVGFILHGVDISRGQKLAYNAGTGVIPSQRGQGLTKKMYEFILPALKADRFNQVVLEVIRENLPAVKTYEKIGFSPLRNLECYRGEVSATVSEAVRIEELKHYDWESLQKCWDFHPSWQNAVPAIELVKAANRSYEAFVEEQKVGYIVYNPLSKRVMQFGVNPNYRRKKIGSSLFSFVKEPGVALTVINVEEGPASQFIENIGLKKFATQLEMKLVLH